MKYQFNRVSGNGKTGPIPTTMTERDSCPSNCGLKGSGCYAESGHVRLWWNKTGTERTQTSSGALYGIDIDELCANIKILPKGQLWRMNVAGDLAHNNQIIDGLALSDIIRANRGKRGFTYTHHKVTGDDNPNKAFVRMSNIGGFTVNLSADTLAQADQYKALDIGPVVCILPIASPKVSTTPAGNTVVLCPATYQENITCASCGICAVASRKSIIGFPAHGIGKKKAESVFRGVAIVKANA